MKKGLFRFDCVLAFACGEGADANKVIARKALQCAAEGGARTIFTQNDIPRWYDFPQSVEVVRATQGEGEYINSLEIILQFKEFAEKRGYKRVLVIAVKQHVRRVVRDMLEEIPELQVFSYKFERPVYVPDDPQPHVRNSWRWWLREIPLRLVQILVPSLYKKKLLANAKNIHYDGE